MKKVLRFGLVALMLALSINPTNAASPTDIFSWPSWLPKPNISWTTSTGLTKVVADRYSNPLPPTFSPMETNGPVTIKNINQGDQILEFTVSSAPGENLYRPAVIFSCTKNGAAEQQKTKLILSLSDDEDGGHVNGRRLRIIQRTYNPGATFKTIDTVLYTQNVAIPISSTPTNKGAIQSTDFSMHFSNDARQVAILAKKTDPGSTNTQLAIYSATDSLLTLLNKDNNDTFVGFSGSPSGQLSYSNISITKVPTRADRVPVQK